MTTQPRPADFLSHSVADLIEHGEQIELPAPAESEPMVQTSLRIPLELLGWAKDEATRRGLRSTSELIRVLLEAQRLPARRVVDVAELERFLTQRSHAA